MTTVLPNKCFFFVFFFMIGGQEPKVCVCCGWHGKMKPGVSLAVFSFVYLRAGSKLSSRCMEHHVSGSALILVPHCDGIHICSSEVLLVRWRAKGGHITTSPSHSPTIRRQGWPSAALLSTLSWHKNWLNLRAELCRWPLSNVQTKFCNVFHGILHQFKTILHQYINKTSFDKYSRNRKPWECCTPA